MTRMFIFANMMTVLFIAFDKLESFNSFEKQI